MKRNDLKSILLPPVLGVVVWLAYRLLGLIHTGLWIGFMLSFGLWFSIAVLKVLKISILNSDRLTFPFIFSGILLYFLTLAYLTKSEVLFLTFRRSTFLLFNGLGYLILVRKVLNKQVKLYDFFVLIAYAIPINIVFTERPFNTFVHLDFLVVLWTITFLWHIGFISMRDRR